MTTEELFQDYFTEEDVARLMGMSVSGLRNRISSGKDHPPFVGRGKAKRFPKADFKKWERARIVHQKNK